MKKMNTECQLGQYQLLRTIASKGHIVIYEGAHVNLKRRAAIKALYLREIRDKRERQQAAERFRQESYRLEQLQHPHIVELYEYGEEDDSAFMVMQFAPYGSLAEFHPLGDLLSFAQIRRYAREIGGALQSLHDNGWIHRDVKPGNIFLGANKQVLLGDFGLVIEDRSRQAIRRFLEYGGTKVYMAPEQAKGEPSPASDQYALATMLFEWLTGFRPFDGTAEEILYQRQYYPAPSLRELAPDVPAAVERVILKALQIAPHHRYGSVREFMQALEYAFDPPVRHRTTVRLPYYAGTSHPDGSLVVHQRDTRPRQHAVSRQQVAGHCSDAPRHARKEAMRDPQFEEFTIQPLPISIHEGDFEVEEGEFELMAADGEGLVRKVWNRLGRWG